MSEMQIASLHVCKDDLSGYDTGGATREVNAVITVDSTLLAERQRECLIHEVLGVYLGGVLDIDMLGQIAQSINDAIRDLEGL